MIYLLKTLASNYCFSKRCLHKHQFFDFDLTSCDGLNCRVLKYFEHNTAIFHSTYKAANESLAHSALILVVAVKLPVSDIALCMS